MASVDISVVICTYNRASMLRLALDALVGQETGGAFTYEIVAVDDGSTDDTPAVIAEFAGNASVAVRRVAGGGQGVAHARNRGAEEARGGWVAYTDDDQVNEPDWLKALYGAACDTGFDCIGGAVHLRLEKAPEAPLTPVTKSILGYKTHPHGEITRLMDCPGTGNVLFRRSVFEQIGFFDESLLWGGEDADFMLRYLRAGLRVYFTPDSVVHHLIPPYRTQTPYFHWASLRVGVALAEVDCRVRGKAKLAQLCIARIGQALLINLPRLGAAKLRGDRGKALETKCLLWRAGTYVRETLHLLAPGLFRQRRFFERLTFRGERGSLDNKTNANSG